MAVGKARTIVNTHITNYEYSEIYFAYGFCDGSALAVVARHRSFTTSTRKCFVQQHVSCPGQVQQRVWCCQRESVNLIACQMQSQQSLACCQCTGSSVQGLWSAVQFLSLGCVTALASETIFTLSYLICLFWKWSITLWLKMKIWKLFLTSNFGAQYMQLCMMKTVTSKISPCCCGL